MTDEELELKAKESFNNKLQKDVCYCTYNEEKIYKDGYIAGAKEVQEANEQLKENIKNTRKKFFDILTDYEIGNYDSHIHQFYKDMYDIHNELMELAE
jgi:hypothetical protein